MSKKNQKATYNRDAEKGDQAKCKQMCIEFAELEYILDDESYFPLSNTSLSGNDRFYSDGVSTTPDHVKNKHKAKYKEKVLV